LGQAALHGERFGDEPPDVQRSLGPGGAALFNRVEQWFGSAAVDLDVRLWMPEQAVEIEKSVLVWVPRTVAPPLTRSFRTSGPTSPSPSTARAA
jgi:hypothetical protein